MPTKSSRARKVFAAGLNLGFIFFPCFFIPLSDHFLADPLFHSRAFAVRLRYTQSTAVAFQDEVAAVLANTACLFVWARAIPPLKKRWTIFFNADVRWPEICFAPRLI
jgi:hypothetical protein